MLKILVYYNIIAILTSLIWMHKTKAKKLNSLKFTWFESFSIRGYMQVRYNRLLETNAQLKCGQCDKSWGQDGGFFIRRMRIIFYGQINKQVYFYVNLTLQVLPSSTSLHFGQLRDAYFDIGVDKANRF